MESTCCQRKEAFLKYAEDFAHPNSLAGSGEFHDSKLGNSSSSSPENVQ
jgi:hypothetical protein